MKFVTSMLSMAIAACVLAGAGVSRAETHWASIGAGCVPTGQSQQTNIHFNSAGRTTFNASSVGEVILTCPITMPFTHGINTSLTVAYRDPDGTGAGARVLATLRRMDQQTGAVDTLAQFDSNTSSVTNFAVAAAGFGNCGPSPFAFDRFYYYVQINMTRSDLAMPVEIAAVALESVNFC